jgi:hypothetical protein
MAGSEQTVAVAVRTLEATPERALKFLRAVGRSSVIRRLLQGRGYTQADHAQGWKLITAVAGVELEPPDDIEDRDARAALRTLNEADEDVLGLIDVTLKHQHPKLHEKLLSGLAPHTDEAKASVVIKLVLERLASLEQATDQDARAANDKLARRGLDAAERQRLAGLIETAQRARQEAGPLPSNSESEAAYLNRLRELRAWYEEWSGVARIVIKRRDLLIQLGLANRRASRTADAKTDDAVDDDTDD